MPRSNGRLIAGVSVAVAAAAMLAGAGLADSTPVGPLPNGPTSAIQSQKGELIAVALPRRGNGRVWRMARPVDARVLRQVSEANVGKNVVLVFRASGSGSATLSFGLTRGETAKAYESRRYTVRVR